MMTANHGKVVGFDPIENEISSVLILGTIPGHHSLVKGEYYANSRNVFWNIMGELVSAGPKLPYEDRINMLIRNGIAVWDVLRACHRQGSSDSKIEADTLEVNDFNSFLEIHPNITHIFFNGAKAQELFVCHVVPNLSPAYRAIGYQKLPSTSPANASMTFKARVEQWRAIMRFTNQLEEISLCA